MGKLNRGISGIHMKGVKERRGGGCSGVIKPVLGKGIAGVEGGGVQNNPLKSKGEEENKKSPNMMIFWMKILFYSCFLVNFSIGKNIFRLSMRGKF